MNDTNQPVVRRFALAQIHPASNARTVFDEAKLQELATSLRDTRGTLQPLLGVLRSDGEVDLIAGERRLRAASLAELEELEVKLVDRPQPKDWLKWNLVENLQREDLRPMEKALRIREMLALVDEGTQLPVYNRASLAEELGISPAHIRRYECLLEAPEKVQKAVNQGEVDMEVAALVGALPAPCRDKAAREMIFRNWGGPMTQDEARKHVADHYRRDLRRAQFDKTALDLVPEAGACAACPFFGANREDVEGKARGYTCLNPSCYDAKQQAHVRMVERLAQGQGTKVLGQASRVFQSWNNEVDPSSGYVDLKDTPSAHLLRDVKAKAPKWEQIVKDAGVPVVVAFDGESRVRHLVESKVAVEAAKRSKHADIFRQDAGSDLKTNDEKRLQQQVSRAGNKAHEAAMVEACAELLQAMSGQKATREVLLQILDDVKNGNFHSDDVWLLCQVMKPDAKRSSGSENKLFHELVEATLRTDEQLLAMIVLTKHIRHIRYNGFGHVRTSMQTYCTWADFDGEKWREEIQERRKTAEREARAKARKSEAPKEKKKAAEKQPKKAKADEPAKESGEGDEDEIDPELLARAREWRAQHPGGGAAALADDLNLKPDVAFRLVDRLVDEAFDARKKARDNEDGAEFDNWVSRIVEGTAKLTDFIGKKPKDAEELKAWNKQRIRLKRAVDKATAAA